MKTVTRCFVAALAIFSAGGCSDKFDHLYFEWSGEPPFKWTMSKRWIEGVEGTAFVVYASPRDKRDEPYAGDASLGLESLDDSIISVTPTTVEREFMLAAWSPGETCISVYVDGEEVGCVTAEIIPQSEAEKNDD